MDHLELEQWRLVFRSDWKKHCLLDLLIHVKAKLPYIHLKVVEDLYLLNAFVS